MVHAWVRLGQGLVTLQGNGSFCSTEEMAHCLQAKSPCSEPAHHPAYLEACWKPWARVCGPERHRAGADEASTAGAVARVWRSSVLSSMEDCLFDAVSEPPLNTNPSSLPSSSLASTGFCSQLSKEVPALHLLQRQRRGSSWFTGLFTFRLLLSDFPKLSSLSSFKTTSISPRSTF